MNDQQAMASSEKRGVLFALSLLTAFFILIELSFFIQCFHTFFYQFAFVSKGLSIPAKIIPDILLFFLAQFGLHLCYLLYTYFLTISILNSFPKLKRHHLTLAIGIWVTGIVAILLANQVYYPNARLSLVQVKVLPTFLAHKLLLLLLVMNAILLLLGCISIIKATYKKLYFYAFLPIILAGSYFLFSTSQIPAKDAGTKAKPNIIIVGMDSLRPDFLGYFGGGTPTPFLDSFLQHATVFSDAVTPLARTFPSWMSILTGLHPTTTGLRSNLARDDLSHINQSLQGILKSAGYNTMYATDESRFNNIDAAYGFDKSVTPRIGLNDFIIGSVNDFPFSNLLLNTRLGAWLFPYSYANRPSFFNYDPNSFLRLLNANIDRQRDKPVFIAVHFCLPHHPYLWADLDTQSITPREWYAKSIARVDTQVKDFFAILQDHRLLEHSIVIVLSDHGEALELDGDRITETDLHVARNNKKSFPHFYPENDHNQKVNQSGGHGTDVLGLPQYHTLLSFKLYGIGQQHTGVIPGVVSLMDIKPTVFDIVKPNIKINHKFLQTNGQSLAPVIKGNAHHVALRHLLIESDFSPEALRSAYPDMNKVAIEGLHIFEINPETSRLTVKPDMQAMIIRSKQFADIYDHWMLAMYPLAHQHYITILVDLNSGEWTDDLLSPLARSAPIRNMREKLQAQLREIHQS